MSWTTRRCATRLGIVQRIVVLGYPDVQALDVIGPCDVFSGATRYLAATAGEGGYSVSLVAARGTAVATGSGLELVAGRLPDPDEPVGTILIPGGFGVEEASTCPATVGWLRRAAPRAERVITICTGAFLAAEAGLLDDRRATTHWAWAARLAERYPGVHVDPEPIFVRSSDRIWTSAGVTAGIDLALALVEADHGSAVAQAVAQWLVLYLRRPGGQSQFAPSVWVPRAKREPIRAVQELIDTRPGERHDIAALAMRAAMSPRHFCRVFTVEVGMSPGAYVERIRIDAARRQLEETDDTIAVIADRCGFGSPETLRRNFVRRVGVAPDHYRKSFSRQPAP